jgi:hypothetical protein
VPQGRVAAIIPISPLLANASEAWISGRRVTVATAAFACQQQRRRLLRPTDFHAEQHVPLISVPETDATSVDLRRVTAELLDVGWVYLDAALERKDLAWSLAQAIVDNATRSDASGAGMPALQIVGRFTLPPPGAECRDFQALHLDFGLPIASNAPTDVVRFTALHIEAGHAPTTAGTRIVALGALLTQRRWDLPERLVDRLRRYARAGFVEVEGILGRLIEVADGTPALPPPGGDLLCGMEFESLAEERHHFAERGLDLDAAEHVVALRPGGLLIFDNLATAHGRLGRRQPLELQQLCLGYRKLDPHHQAELLARVMAQFTGTPATAEYQP